ncbi:MAG TPA: putative Ig domain-containing protein, partial [Nitrospira sp.]
VNLVVPADTFADVDAGDVLTYTASLANGGTLPSWLSFDATARTFSGTPDDAQVGSLELRVMATDLAQESVFDEFTLTVTNVNEAPTLGAPLVDRTVNEDTAFIFTIPEGTFADVDQVHGDALLYGASLPDGGSLPAWLTFDAATRTFSGTPDNGDVGTLDVVVTATDLGDLSVTGHLALTVENVNDAPTVVIPIADQTAAEDDPFSLTIPADTFADDDARHGDVLSYQATLVDGRPLPAWTSFNSTMRTFSGIPGAGDAGTLQIMVTATDASQVSVNDDFVLAISGPLPKTLVGTAGNDVLIGGRGHDTLSGLAGNDQLQGGMGNDLLDGGTGTDTMVGGTGNDVYVVNVAGDVVTELANEGTDTVQSSITYTLGANVENLTLTGTTVINGTGNALDNTLTGNSGINVLTGGAGNDTYVVGAGDSVIESFNGGTDTILSAVTWTLASNVEHLTLTGSADVNGTGNVLNNTLMGNNGNNALDGGAGNDLLDGGAGNDSLLGGSGDDQLFGGLGTDVLNAGSGHDVLNGGEGTDTLDGGSGDDQLFGGGGNDTMTGGSGADQFMGGSGNDTMTGGSGNDMYSFVRGDGQDTIIDTDPFPSNQDRTVFGETINPLDLVISRQANDLRLTIHGSSDQITVQNWYMSPTANQIETIQAGNGKTLLNTQVDQLIQAMAAFSSQSGLTWDQAIDQRPQDVQTVLAASWQ